MCLDLTPQHAQGRGQAPPTTKHPTLPARLTFVGAAMGAAMGAGGGESGRSCAGGSQQPCSAAG